MGKKEDKGREHGQEWTRKEKIEQLAADIIHSSTIIQGLRPSISAASCVRVYQSAKSIGFHAEGILKALEVEDE